jgi:hypothetical protein
MKILRISPLVYVLFAVSTRSLLGTVNKYLFFSFFFRETSLPIVYRSGKNCWTAETVIRSEGYARPSW